MAKPPPEQLTVLPLRVGIVKKDKLEELKEKLGGHDIEAVRAEITAAEKAANVAAVDAAIQDRDAAVNAAAYLGNLILGMNLYTNSQDKDRNRFTGEMEIIKTEPVEMEGPYAQEWTFKGHPQKVGMAARVKYKYPVRNAGSEILFWVEDYLLIGFQGSMGG